MPGGLALGATLFRRGEVEIAGTWWQRCQRAIDDGCEVGDRVRLLVLNNLGGVRYHCGDHGAALEVFKRAARAMERELGSEHPDVVRPLSNVAWVALEAGRLDASSTSTARSVACRERVLVPTDPIRLAALCAHAALALAAGDLATAVQRVDALVELERDLDDTRVDTNAVTRAVATELVGALPGSRAPP